MSDPVFAVQDLLVRYDDGRVVESRPVRVVTDPIVTNAKGDPVEAEPVFVTSGSVGAGITPTSISIPAFTASGTTVATLAGPEGAVFSIVSGPFTITGGNQLVLSAPAGDEGTTQTARVKAEVASPFLSITQDIVVTAGEAGEGPPVGFVYALSPVTGQQMTSPVSGELLIKAA